MNVKNMLKEALAEIKPDDGLKKLTLQKVNAFLKDLNQHLKNAGATARLGGSFAKDTWLKGDHDVDIFVVFKNKADSDILEKALKHLRAERIHGSRDYFQVKSGITYEIIPVQKKPENITDYSLSHVSWVNKKNFKDDILLAKKFCKTIGVYGAESYIRGFSGHVIDILTIHYKGFLSLLKATAKWKQKTVIDTNNEYKGRALQIMNTSKTTGPLILIDPLQKDRNAAAALSMENYDEFIKQAKTFLKKPGKKFVEERPPDYKSLQKKGWMVIQAEPNEGKPDVELTKIAKVFDYIKQHTAEYKITASKVQWTKKPTMQVLYKTKQLPLTYEQQGPPTKLKEHAQAFKKGRKTFVKKGRVWAVMKRKNTMPIQAIQQIIKENYVKQRVKTVTCGKQ